MSGVLNRWQMNFSGNERIDLPDFQNAFAQVDADFSNMLQLMVVGDYVPRVLQRYQVTTPTVANTFTMANDLRRGLIDASQDWLNVQPNTVGTTVSLPITSSTTNYIEVLLYTSMDNLQTRAFWDTDIGTTGQEFFDSINIRTRIDEQFNVRTDQFSGGLYIPLYQVVVNGSGAITAIYRADDLLWKNRVFSLPNAVNRYAVYESPLKNERSYIDFVGAIVGEMKGILNTANTTGNVSNGSNVITNVASVTGIGNGQRVFGTGIPSGTTVVSVNGAAGTVTLNQNATATNTGVSLAFYGSNLIESSPWSTLKLLREYQNMFYTRGGDISFEVSPLGANQIGWDQEFQIEIAGRNTVYTVAPTILPVVTPTANTHSNTTIDNLSSMSGVFVGQNVSGSGIQAGTTVTAINVGSNSITISLPATSSLTGATITFYAVSGNTHTSVTIDGLNTTYGIFVGSTVTGSGVQAGTTVTAILSSSSIQVSLATTSSLSGTPLAFTYGYTITDGQCIYCDIPEYPSSTAGATAVGIWNLRQQPTAGDVVNFFFPDGTSYQLTWVASSPGANQVLIGANVVASIDNMETAINTAASLTNKLSAADQSISITGNISTGSNQITAVSSTTGLYVGQEISNFPSQANGNFAVLITAINGSTVTVNSYANTTATGYSFYVASMVLTAGSDYTYNSGNRIYLTQNSPYEDWSPFQLTLEGGLVPTQVVATVATMSSLVMDPNQNNYIGRSATVLFMRRQDTIYGAMDIPELQQGQTVVIGNIIDQTLQGRLGINIQQGVQPTYVAYTSTNFIASNASYATALSALDAQAGTQQTAANQNQAMRLIGGGTWSWNVGTGVLAWSGGANVMIGGLADSVNVIAAGNITMSDGDVGYVPVNRSGAGGTIVPVDTPVASFANANNNNIIFARRSGSIVYVGIGSQIMVLRDGEQKTLMFAGFGVIDVVTAGANLTQTQAVYISQGASDGSRTQGDAYLTDASGNNGLGRQCFAGFVMTSVSSAASVSIVTNGLMSGFTGLTQGAPYYLDPTTPGGITSTRPTTPGQYQVPVGLAISTTELYVISSGEFRARLNAWTAATAGVNITANQAVYISPGTGVDSLRTAGQVYLTDAGSTNGAIRGIFAGFAVATVTTPNTINIAQSGVLPGFTGLTPGVIYYLDPANPGGITATKPTTTGQYLCPVGVAVTSTSLWVSAALGTEISLIGSTTNVAATISQAFSTGLGTGGFATASTSYGYVFTNTSASATAGAIYQVATTVTISDASPGVITTPVTHNLVVGTPVKFATTGALPSPLIAGTTYYVSQVPGTTTFQVAYYPGGASINTTTAGSGTQTLNYGSFTVATTTSSQPALQTSSPALVVNANLTQIYGGTVAPLTGTTQPIAPPVSGTLSLVSGTGSSTITFSLAQYWNAGQVGTLFTCTTGTPVSATGGDHYQDQKTCTITIAAPAVLTASAAHGLIVGQPITLSTTGALPTGLVAGTTYYVSAVPSSTQFQLSTTQYGASLTTTGTQSGTQTVNMATYILEQGSNLVNLLWTQNAAVAGYQPGPTGTLIRVTGSDDSSITYTASQPAGLYTVPTSPRQPLYIEGEIVAGGGGGAGGGSGSTPVGTAGTLSAFGVLSLVCYPGQPGGQTNAGAGGTPFVMNSAFATILKQLNGGGGGGAPITASEQNCGGNGGVNPFGGGGFGSDGGLSGQPLMSGAPNSGAGGGGAGNGDLFPGAGGGAGAYIQWLISQSNLSASYLYVIGLPGIGGTSATTGGNAGSGFAIMKEHYN